MAGSHEVADPGGDEAAEEADDAHQWRTIGHQGHDGADGRAHEGSGLELEVEARAQHHDKDAGDEQRESGK